MLFHTLVCKTLINNSEGALRHENELIFYLCNWQVIHCLSTASQLNNKNVRLLRHKQQLMQKVLDKVKKIAAVLLNNLMLWLMQNLASL